MNRELLNMFKVGINMISLLKFILCLIWPWVPIEWICWFSGHFFDIHDYPKNRGGDDTPSHFYTYTCWNCEKKFGI